jgi:hypothetical protein
MDTKRLAGILREKRRSLRRQNSALDGWTWTKYLKGNGVRKVGVTGIAKMANKGELDGKTVVQTDFDLTDPAKNNDELEGLHATDVHFYVMDRETAEKILVLGLP